MKYLVCRTDAIRPAGTIKNSSHFPMVVEVQECEWDGTDWAEIVLRKALSSISSDYSPNHSYMIVPMTEAITIQRRPIQPEYRYVMTPWR